MKKPLLIILAALISSLAIEFTSLGQEETDIYNLDINKPVEVLSVVFEPKQTLEAIPIYGDNATVWLMNSGISKDDWEYVNFIISHESSWRADAVNWIGCTGLGQSCPSSKLTNACPNWQTDAICQLKFFDTYARDRYGSWQRAAEFWVVNAWW